MTPTVLDPDYERWAADLDAAPHPGDPPVTLNDLIDRLLEIRAGHSGAAPVVVSLCPGTPARGVSLVAPAGLADGPGVAVVLSLGLRTEDLK